MGGKNYFLNVELNPELDPFEESTTVGLGIILRVRKFLV